MKKIYIFCSLLVLLAVSCTPRMNRTQANDPSIIPVGTPSLPATELIQTNSQNQSTNTPSLPPESTTSKPLIAQTNPHPTLPALTPFASTIEGMINAEIPSELSSLNLNGAIWIRLDWNSGAFLMIDFENKAEPIQVINFPGCVKLLPNSVEALCLSEDQTFLFNLVTGESKNLPMNPICWDAPSSSGKFLAFEECEPADQDYEAQLFDLNKGVIQPIAHFSERRGNRPWNTDPFLSFDGKHLVIQNGEGIFDIRGDNPYQQISEKHLQPTWDMAWSPTENILLFGATDVETEFGYDISHLYLYDVGTRETSLLFEANDNLIKSFLNQEVWSPDGKQLVSILGKYAPSEVELCIFSIRPVKADCQPIAENDENVTISIPAWSPDSKFLVFEQKDRNTNTVSIKIYSIDTKNIYTLFVFSPEASYYHDLDIQRIFWRVRE